MSFDPLFSSLWRFDNNLTIADPGDGRWRWNNSYAPTQLAISVIEVDSGDRSANLDGLLPMDHIVLRSTSTSQNWAMFTVLTATDMGTWFRFGVEVFQTGAVAELPTNNERTLIDFMRPVLASVNSGPIEDKRDEIIARVATLLHVPAEDVWCGAAVDAAIEYAIDATNRQEVGLPDTALTVNGIVIFATRLYTDTPNGAQVAIGDPSFDPIFQPESLWKHVRHYFDHLDVAWGVA